jgi:hypothetical protein
MKEIKLSNGLVTIVDDEDYEDLSQYKWGYHKGGNHARRAFWITPKKRGTIEMHRLIMKPPKDMVVDHINMDGLDNRRANLRVCTFKQNCQNRKVRPDNKVGFKGVFRLKDGRFQVTCANKYVGKFDTAESAARAYDERAKEVYGEFARFNFPEVK